MRRKKEAEAIKDVKDHFQLQKTLFPGLNRVPKRSKMSKITSRSSPPAKFPRASCLAEAIKDVKDHFQPAEAAGEEMFDLPKRSKMSKITSRRISKNAPGATHNRRSDQRCQRSLPGPNFAVLRSTICIRPKRSKMSKITSRKFEFQFTEELFGRSDQRCQRSLPEGGGFAIPHRHFCRSDQRCQRSLPERMPMSRSDDPFAEAIKDVKDHFQFIDMPGAAQLAKPKRSKMSKITSRAACASARYPGRLTSIPRAVQAASVPAGDRARLIGSLNY